MSGKRFGRWIVVDVDTAPRTSGHVRWNCICDCGAKKSMSGPALVYGSSKSCGCLQRDTMRRLKTVHGLKGTPEYRSWKHMRERCNNPNEKSYPNYGGRGIFVCDKWNDFREFLDDVGLRPGPRYSIERINVNGHYVPSNVVWATPKVQSRNKRRTVYAEVDGMSGKVSDIADVMGEKYNSVLKRAKRGTRGARIISKEEAESLSPLVGIVR